MHRTPSSTRSWDSLCAELQRERSVIPVEELISIRDRSPNVLILGTDSVTGAAVAEMRALLRLPVTSVSVNASVALPLSLTRGTLIVRDVGNLALPEQHRLHDWLTRTSGRAQVVATSAVSLCPLVETGAFLDVLYYRLNTLCLAFDVQ